MPIPMPSLEKLIYTRKGATMTNTELTNMLTQPSLTPELVRGDRQMTDAEVTYKTGTVLHEAAHLVAACACPGSSILSVWIHPTGRRKKTYIGPNAGAAGTTNSLEVYEDEECFVSLASYYWEENFGNSTRAESDWRRGKKLGYEYVHDQADAFVRANKALIEQVAVGILTLANKDGTLRRGKLDKLVALIRARVPKYHSKFAPPKRTYTVNYPSLPSSPTPSSPLASSTAANS